MDAHRSWNPAKVGIAADDHEQVVEIVSYTASELADGVHFLRLEQLRFQLPALGDIAIVGIKWVISPAASRTGAIVFSA